MYIKYYLITDNGDGSSSVQWFDEKPDLEALEEEDPETYFGNEGYIGTVKSETPIEVN